PSRVEGLADQRCRIGTGPRTEFLETSGIDLRDIEVALLVGGNAMHAPKCAREIAKRAPRIDEAPVELVLEHLVGIAIESRELAIVADHDEVQARRAHVDLPLGEVLAVLVEDLDAVVVAIVDEYAPRLDVNSHAMHVVHVARARFLARVAVLAEI